MIAAALAVILQFASPDCIPQSGDVFWPCADLDISRIDYLPETTLTEDEKRITFK